MQATPLPPYEKKAPYAPTGAFWLVIGSADGEGVISGKFCRFMWQAVRNHLRQHPGASIRSVSRREPSNGAPDVVIFRR